MVRRKDAQALITQAAFLINQHHQLLILQLPDKRWQLPGGKLQCGENWTDGLKREIYEETQLDDIRVVSVLYIDNWSTPTNDYYRAYFLCTTLSEKIQLSADHLKYEWINANTNISAYEFTHQTVITHIQHFLKQL